MTVEIETSEIERLAKEQEQDLGAPDFSSLMDDDEAEITGEHISPGQNQVSNSLKVGELVAMVAGMSFNFVAARKGEHWKLTPDEAQELATATDKCVDEYFPEFECSPVMLLAGVSAGIVAPRMLVDAKIAMQQAKEEGEHDNQES